MAFSLTKSQILYRHKTVTRRLGWSFLKPGDLIQAVEKGMGLKKGEKVNRLAVLRVVAVRSEMLCLIGIYPEDTAREGFPWLTADEFVAFFCRSHKGCTPKTIVTRIEFEYAEGTESRRTEP